MRKPDSEFTIWYSRFDHDKGRKSDAYYRKYFAHVKATREQRIINAKRWREKNPEKKREYQRRYAIGYRERRHFVDKLWRRKNREHYSLRYKTRYAKRKSAPGWTYTTPQHIQWRWDMFGGKCWICGKDAVSIDHVKPITKGGTHWPANLRPACKVCNSAKHNTWPYPIKIKVDVLPLP